MTVPFRDLRSPNQDDRPAGTPIDMIVMHYTGTLTADEAVRRLCDPAARVSAHYLVDEDGTVLRLVDERRRAWHAGASYWRGKSDLNDGSIGIEVVNPGHEWGYRPFGALQMATVCDLCLELLSRHSIPARNIVGHADIAPERKQDPGELFDWEGLAMNGVGVWPDDVPDLGTGGVQRDAASLGEVRAALAAIGYGVAGEGASEPSLSAVLRAFQRHWRQDAITGEADAGTVARLAAVVRLADPSG